MTSVSDVRKALYTSTRQRESRMVVGSPQVREEGDGTFKVSGYACVTDAPYEVRDWLGEYTETIARGAFAKSLRESEDVRLLLNHDGVPLARTRSRTLTLTEITNPADDPQGRGQTGLWCEADIDASSPLAQTVRSAMARGDLDEMSFAFAATKQEWNEDYTQRTVNECRLYDVSIVTYPANPATSVQLNSAEMQGLAARMAAGSATRDDQAKIAELMGVLAAIESASDEAVESAAEHLGLESEDDMEPESDAPEVDDEAERSARVNALEYARRKARSH